MRALVVGAGYVGGKLTEQLCSRGHTVTAIRRRVPAEPSSATWILADVTSFREGSLSEDYDWVVYCVGAENSSDEAYRKAYLDGPRALVDALSPGSRNRGRFVYVSSSGVFGENQGELLDETSEPRPSRENSRWMLEGESFLASRLTDVVVVRFSGIYGPTRTRLVREAVEADTATRPLAREFTNRIHRDDCAGMLLHLLTHPAPERLYIGTDCEPAERWVVVSYVREVLGLPPIALDDRYHSLPAAGKQLSNRRILESGYRFNFPTFREGYVDIIKNEQASAGARSSHRL